MSLHCDPQSRDERDRWVPLHAPDEVEVETIIAGIELMFRRLSELDAAITSRGVIAGSIQSKHDRPSGRLAILTPRAPGTKKRSWIFLGSDPQKHAVARAGIERFAVRRQLRKTVDVGFREYETLLEELQRVRKRLLSLSASLRNSAHAVQCQETDIIRKYEGVASDKDDLRPDAIVLSNQVGNIR